MSSVIAPEPRAKCRGCGGKEFNSKVYDQRFKLSIKACTKCGDYPDSLRLRRMLPIGRDGESIRVEIRYNRMGERITTVDEAMHIARSIDYDLKDGRFDPNDYRSKAMTASYLFKALIKEKYLPYYENKLSKQEISRSGFDTKKVMLNHLGKFFDEFDVRKIKARDIKEFYLTFKGGDRSKDLSVEELRVFLTFCKDLEIIRIVPTLPKTKQSGIKNVENFLTEDEQKKVLQAISDEYYRDMIEILSIYAMRPCEIRALKWSDLNFKDKTITIQNHFSKSTITKGRKSNERALTLPMTERFEQIVAKLPRSINSDEFVFVSKNGSGAVGEARLRKYWNAACKKAKVKISLYEGTKHSRLTELKAQGHKDEELMLLTGHTQVKTFRRYGQETNQNKLKKIRNLINKESVAAQIFQ